MRRRTGAGEQKRSRDDDRDPERRLDCRQYGLRAPAKGNTGAVDNAEQQDRRHATACRTPSCQRRSRPRRWNVPCAHTAGIGASAERNVAKPTPRAIPPNPRRPHPAAQKTCRIPVCSASVKVLSAGMRRHGAQCGVRQRSGQRTAEPATSQAASASVGEPTCRDMIAALKNTPAQMIDPITTAVALRASIPEPAESRLRAFGQRA